MERSCFILLLLWFFAPRVSVGQAIPTDSLRTLDELEVVARHRHSLTPMQELGGVALQRLSVLSVADALRYFSGVQIKDYGGLGGLKTVDVRNMGSHHVAVYYDGVQIGNAQNGVVDLGKYSLDDLESLKLYVGHRADILQGARQFAGGASIYLEGRRPSFAGGKRTNLILRYRLGTIQLANPSFRLERKLSSSLSASLSGEYLQSDGRYRFRYKRFLHDGSVAYDTTAIRRNSDIRAFRLEGGLYGSGGGSSWQAKVYYYDSDRGLPGAIVKNIWYTGERQGDRNLFLQGQWEQALGERYRLRLSGKWAFDYTHYLSNEIEEFGGVKLQRRPHYDNRYYQHEGYLSLAQKFMISRGWDVAWSVDAQYNNLMAKELTSEEPFADPVRWTLYSSVFSALRLGERFSMQGGVLFTYSSDRAERVPTIRSRTQVSPSLGLQYLLNSSLRLEAFAKESYRLPTFSDLYYTQIGYSLLRPERNRQANLSISYLKSWTEGALRRLDLSLGSYLALIEDKIIAAPTGSSFRWMMSNMGHVHSWGMELKAGADFKIGRMDASTRLSYTYSDARDYTLMGGRPLSSYGDQIPYTPWHSGSVVSTLLYKGWELNYSFIYVGGRYNGAVNNIPRNYVEPWYTHDLSLAKGFAFGRVLRAKVSLEVNNLFDQQYDVVANYPMPGRNGRLRINIRL